MSSLNSLNSRFKGLGFGKRKSTASIPSPDNNSQHQLPPPLSNTHTPPPQIPQQFPVPAQAQAGPPGAAPSLTSSSSQQIIPTMNHPGAGPRPPSYSANFPPGAPPPVGRTSPLTHGPARTPPSQMVGGPPPINTGAPVSGYPPQMGVQPGGHPPPGIQGGPPGYAGYPPPAPPPQPGPPMQQFGRPAPPPAEAEGQSRSKAQLIVGIDFVCTHSYTEMSQIQNGRALTTLPNNRELLSPVLPSLLQPTTRPRKISSRNGLVLDHTRSKRCVRFLSGA